MLFVKFVDKLNRVLEFLIGLGLAAMTVVVFLQVFVRFVLGALHIDASMPWTEELARYLMIWSVFIGGAVVSRKGDSLAVEALVKAVPLWVGKKIKTASYIVVIIFYAYIFVIGLEMAQLGLLETAPVLKLPMVYVYSAMSIGAALTILNVITLLIDIYINKKEILDMIDFEVEDAITNYKKDGEGASV
ncbi:TRAP transporter small permease [Ammoniphilus sp. YIM 78166]|uniref:TRAP transporter small permease n=1 Tax=Ammoniphilus sp. YIM 78166 TaxID=1644106 RepID=UPI00106F3CE0|nr:TRAP transporter small permease [Ammoniphilus sp. YIM 78166]